MPLSLIRTGEGEAAQNVLPEQIGVPKGAYLRDRNEYVYTEAADTLFNYYTDEEAGELVFFNYAAVPAYTVNAWQILYDLPVKEAAADSRWSFIPQVSAGGVDVNWDEEEDSPKMLAGEAEYDPAAEAAGGDGTGDAEVAEAPDDGTPDQIGRAHV